MSDKKKKTQAQDERGQGEAAGGDVQRPAADNEAPVWFKSWQEQHQKQLDARFDGISRKQRETIRKLIDPDQEPDEEKKAAPKGLTQDDVDARVSAAMRLGEVKASLPEGARKRVDQFAKTHPITDVVEFAETLLEMQPESSKDDRKTARAGARGVGASPPQDEQVPVSKEELRELAKQAATDPEARKRMIEIAKSPGFSRKSLVG